MIVNNVFNAFPAVSRADDRLFGWMGRRRLLNVAIFDLHFLLFYNLFTCFPNILVGIVAATC
jgi:hypothetical protein